MATTIFVLIGIEKVGRSKALGTGSIGMSTFLWIIGAIYYTHIPDVKATTPSHSSIAMAAMSETQFATATSLYLPPAFTVYCFVIPYCWSWGPVPWVYWCGFSHSSASLTTS